jgi:pimeloyl-ACP methyl ester carboxylesterase
VQDTNKEGVTSYTAGDEQHTREHVLADRRTIGYALYGAHDGVLVMVLDGPGSRGLGRAMSPSAARLGIKLLVPDRPGFGRSTPTKRGLFAEVANDLLALVDLLAFRRFGIVAQSGGTPYALALAAAGGERATGLAFVGAVAPLHERHALRDVTGPARNMFLLARYAPWLLGPLARAVARQTAKDPEVFARKYAERLPAADRRVLDDPAMWAIHATSCAEITSRPAALAGEMRMLVRPWGIDYNRISAPAALWVGELDPSHGPPVSRRLATLLDGASVTVVPGAATFAMVVVYPDVLCHAAALPEHLEPRRQRALGSP